MYCDLVKHLDLVEEKFENNPNRALEDFIRVKKVLKKVKSKLDYLSNLRVTPGYKRQCQYVGHIRRQLPLWILRVGRWIRYTRDAQKAQNKATQMT